MESDRKSHIVVISAEDSAYMAIRDMILEGHYVEGDRLRYVELSKMLKMSKTPIISALSRLAEDGMTEYAHNRGYRVTKKSGMDASRKKRIKRIWAEEGSRLQEVDMGGRSVSSPIKSLSQGVYEHIKDYIRDSWFAPGQKLVSNDLEEKFGVSKTPITQALSRLESEGYVFLKPNAGYYVREFSYEDIEGLFKIREALEMANVDLVLARSTEDLTEDLQELEDIHQEMLNCSSPTYNEIRLEINRRFHLKLASMGRNRLMNEYITRVYDFFDMRLKLNFSFLPSELVNRVNVEHGRILVALREGNEERLKKALWLHLNAASSNLLKYIKDKQR